MGRQQAEAAVAVFRVVSGEEDLAVEPGRASWIEPNRSGNPDGTSSNNQFEGCTFVPPTIHRPFWTPSLYLLR